MNAIATTLLVVLIGGCAAGGDPKATPTKDQSYRAAHLACHQRMMAGSTIGWGMTPNRHIYMMCMKDKGYDI